MDVRDYFGSQKTLVFSGKAQPVTVLDSPNDFRMISYFRDEAEKVTTDPHDYPARVDGQGAARYTVPPGRRL